MTWEYFVNKIFIFVFPPDSMQCDNSWPGVNVGAVSESFIDECNRAIPILFAQGMSTAEPLEAGPKPLFFRDGSPHRAVVDRIYYEIISASIDGQRTCHGVWGPRFSGKRMILTALRNRLRAWTTSSNTPGSGRLRKNVSVDAARPVIVVPLNGRTLSNDSEAMRFVCHCIDEQWDALRSAHPKFQLPTLSAVKGRCLSLARSAHSQFASTREGGEVVSDNEADGDEDDERSPVDEACSPVYFQQLLLLVTQLGISVALLIDDMKRFAVWCDRTAYIISGLLHESCGMQFDVTGRSGGVAEVFGTINIVFSARRQDVGLEKRIASRLSYFMLPVPVVRVDLCQCVDEIVTAAAQSTAMRTHDQLVCSPRAAPQSSLFSSPQVVTAPKTEEPRLTEARQKLLATACDGVRRLVSETVGEGPIVLDYPDALREVSTFFARVELKPASTATTATYELPMNQLHSAASYYFSTPLASREAYLLVMFTFLVLKTPLVTTGSLSNLDGCTYLEVIARMKQLLNVDRSLAADISLHQLVRARVLCGSGAHAGNATPTAIALGIASGALRMTLNACSQELCGLLFSLGPTLLTSVEWTVVAGLLR